MQLAQGRTLSMLHGFFQLAKLGLSLRGFLSHRGLSLRNQINAKPVVAIIYCLLCLCIEDHRSWSAIVGSGDINPNNPVTWTNGTFATIGQNDLGMVTVNGNSDLFSSSARIGDSFGSTGRVNVDGSGSTWTNSFDLYPGNGGSGTMSISNGGAVSNGEAYIGNSFGSIGRVNVDGAGSRWMNSQGLHVGNRGNGTLNITSGGTVNNDRAYIADGFGSIGRVNVGGVGSTWITDSGLYVGEEGTGTLTINSGGTVSSDFAYIGDSFGSSGRVILDGLDAIWTNGNGLTVGFLGDGTINILGGATVSNNDAYIGDAPGSTGLVEVDGIGSTWVSGGYIYVGNQGAGTLNITGGGTVSSFGSYIGHYAASQGTVTVSGIGSIWTTRELILGYGADSTLNILEAGKVTVAGETTLLYGTVHLDQGTLVTSGLIGAAEDFTGEGTIYARGLVSDVDLVFDAAHGLSQSFILDNSPGQNISLHLDVDGTGSLGAGYRSHGTMSISDGITVHSSGGYIGHQSGSTGQVTVAGGSSWSINQALYVGQGGSGTLNIASGATVSSYGAVIAQNTGSTGVINVNGLNSAWTNNGYLHVGNGGHGMLNITNGGSVLVAGQTLIVSGEIHMDEGTLNTGGLIGSIDDLTGEGVIHSQGLVTDLNLAFDASHGLIQSFVLNDNPGQNITLHLNVTGSAAMGAGYVGSGTMSIREGVYMESSEGYIGYQPGSTGQVTVTGADSTWSNSQNLFVGYDGNGTLNIADGGSVSAFTSLIGENPASTGQVSVEGVGSSWTTNGNLFVGLGGNGRLDITAGGTVSNTYEVYVGYNPDSTGVVTVSGADSTWTSTGALYVGNLGDGILNITDGGSVRNTQGTVGNASGATGEVDVKGTGSSWVNSSSLFVGYNSGQGTLSIKEGGLVSVFGTLFIDFDGNGSGLVNMASGGMLALRGDADDSLAQFLNMISGSDALRYWDGNLLDWSNLSNAVSGSDYTLQYQPSGSLAGYTLLTVHAPGPAIGTPGDFDSDGDVDGRDFLAWQRNPGIGDLADWRANYGSGALTGVRPTLRVGARDPARSSVVPEPVALSVLLVGLAVLPLRSAGAPRRG